MGVQNDNLGAGIEERIPLKQGLKLTSPRLVGYCGS